MTQGWGWNRRGWLGQIMTAFVCGVLACRSATPPLPSDAVSFSPPAIYTRWWAMTEACSGHTGDLSALRWYRSPSSAVFVDGESVNGYWTSDGNRIVLAEESVDNGSDVRHEMLHALLEVRGHPRAQFLGSCASVLRCGESCASEGGPWRPATRDYLVLPPDSLEVRSTAELLSLEKDGQRWVSLELTVENPRDQAVVIAAPGGGTTPRIVAFDVRGPKGGIGGWETAYDSSQVFFLPHEIKSRLFEFRVTSELTQTHIPSGTHLLRAGYGENWSPYDTVVVSP